MEDCVDCEKEMTEAIEAFKKTYPAHPLSGMEADSAAEWHRQAFFLLQYASPASITQYAYFFYLEGE